jgi:hypothetical protein
VFSIVFLAFKTRLCYESLNGRCLTIQLLRLSRNVSTTPLRQWGFRQCLPFSWTTLRGKHCRHPIAVMGFRLSVLVLNNVTLQKHFALKLQFTYPSFSYSFFSSMLVLLFNQINEQFCNCQHDHYYSEFMGKRC